jgi:hypothetical protein
MDAPRDRLARARPLTGTNPPCAASGVVAVRATDDRLDRRHKSRLTDDAFTPAPTGAALIAPATTDRGDLRAGSRDRSRPKRTRPNQAPQRACDGQDSPVSGDVDPLLLFRPCGHDGVVAASRRKKEPALARFWLTPTAALDTRCGSPDDSSADCSCSRALRRARATLPVGQDPARPHRRHVLLSGREARAESPSMAASGAVGGWMVVSRRSTYTSDCRLRRRQPTGCALSGD